MTEEETRLFFTKGSRIKDDEEPSTTNHHKLPTSLSKGTIAIGKWGKRGVKIASQNN